MTPVKLYFCGECKCLHGRNDPEDRPGLKCENCGEAFDNSGTIIGEFAASDATLMENDR
jgi:hypothetical protein